MTSLLLNLLLCKKGCNVGEKWEGNSASICVYYAITLAGTLGGHLSFKPLFHLNMEGRELHTYVHSISSFMSPGFHCVSIYVCCGHRHGGEPGSPWRRSYLSNLSLFLRLGWAEHVCAVRVVRRLFHEEACYEEAHNMTFQ
jgi:hypothetical protein